MFQSDVSLREIPKISKGYKCLATLETTWILAKSVCLPSYHNHWKLFCSKFKFAYHTVIYSDALGAQRAIQRKRTTTEVEETKQEGIKKRISHFYYVCCRWWVRDEAWVHKIPSLQEMDPFQYQFICMYVCMMLSKVNYMNFQNLAGANPVYNYIIFILSIP